MSGQSNNHNRIPKQLNEILCLSRKNEAGGWLINVEQIICGFFLSHFLPRFVKSTHLLAANLYIQCHCLKKNLRFLIYNVFFFFFFFLCFDLFLLWSLSLAFLSRSAKNACSTGFLGPRLILSLGTG